MNRSIKLVSLALMAATMAVFATPASAAEKPAVYTSALSNLAVGGYDTVSFFSGEPVKGSSDFSTEYNGAQWLFSSQDNLDQFLANPTVFAPQYGGYCAWATAKGSLAKGDPKYYKVVDGKLYLNFSAGVQKKWNADIPGFIMKADMNWPAILTR